MSLFHRLKAKLERRKQEQDDLQESPPAKGKEMSNAKLRSKGAKTIADGQGIRVLHDPDFPNVE